MDTFGVYTNKLKAFPPLSQEEFNFLFIQWKCGNQEAFESLVKHNLRLVISHAKRYNHNDCFEDLVQEGNIGLIKALEHFDPKFGVKFSTYATYWINQGILRRLKKEINEDIVKGSGLDLLDEYNHKAVALTRQYRRFVTQEEVFTSLKWCRLVTDKKTKQNKLVYDSRASTVKGLMTFDLLELDSPMTEDGDSFHEVIGDPEAFNTRKFLMKLQAEIFLDKLTAQERGVIVRHFGLEGHEEESLEDIAYSLGKSRESIRKIEFYAFRKLKQYITQRDDYWAVKDASREVLV